LTIQGFLPDCGSLLGNSIAPTGHLVGGEAFDGRRSGTCSACASRHAAEDSKKD